MRNEHVALLGLTLCTLFLAQSEPALAQVVFTKAETVATGVLASFRGTLATAFFGIAFVVTGFLAAFNRISWAWVALVIVGAFLVFAGPAIVANLRSSFSRGRARLMEKSAVILGLSRQARFLGLPMPYAMAVGAATVLPFILFKPVWWFLTAPIWYGLARFATKLNPNGHHVFAVMMQVTPMAILRKGRHHVS